MVSQILRAIVNPEQYQGSGVSIAVAPDLLCLVRPMMMLRRGEADAVVMAQHMMHTRHADVVPPQTAKCISVTAKRRPWRVMFLGCKCRGCTGETGATPQGAPGGASAADPAGLAPLHEAPPAATVPPETEVAAAADLLLRGDHASRCVHITHHTPHPIRSGCVLKAHAVLLLCRWRMPGLQSLRGHVRGGDRMNGAL